MTSTCTITKQAVLSLLFSGLRLLVWLCPNLRNTVFLSSGPSLWPVFFFYLLSWRPPSVSGVSRLKIKSTRTMISSSARHLSADRGTKELFSLLLGPSWKTLQHSGSARWRWETRQKSSEHEAACCSCSAGVRGCVHIQSWDVHMPHAKVRADSAFINRCLRSRTCSVKASTRAKAQERPDQIVPSRHLPVLL